MITKYVLTRPLAFTLDQREWKAVLMQPGDEVMINYETKMVFIRTPGQDWRPTLDMISQPLLNHLEKTDAI